MNTTLTDIELKELKSRFKSIEYKQLEASSEIVHTLSTGRIVKGYVTEDNTLFVSSVKSYLCG